MDFHHRPSGGADAGEGALTAYVADVIAENTSGVYHCTRVWQAWNIGTMHESDFEPYSESDSPRDLAETIVDAIRARTTQEG